MCLIRLVLAEFELLIHSVRFHHHVLINDRQVDQHYVFGLHESLLNRENKKRVFMNKQTMFGFFL